MTSPLEDYSKRIDAMIVLKLRERDTMRESYQRISGELIGLQTAKAMMEDMALPVSTAVVNNEADV